MKLVNPTEHAIYAAAFVARLNAEVAIERPASFSWDEWASRAANLAIYSAEQAVRLHREAIKGMSRS